MEKSTMSSVFMMAFALLVLDLGGGKFGGFGGLVSLTDACKISEFPCRGGALCLPLDKYCDGRDDCGDASDEPKYCTVCNRTYYGDVGRTYSLRVPPPQWNRLPFLCHLTFTASGHEQGDIVQLIFDAFSVGRFDEGLIDLDSEAIDTSLSPIGELPGCPDGFMQLSELGRPFTGGSWCGSATGPQLYFSETSTVTASVKVFHAPMQAVAPFEFRIRYKFISQSDAIVRYGPPESLLELGKVTPGTYCTRQFDECNRSKCRLQSPNYPGMYPRNVTCYWTIRQKFVPTCKHAMVAVSQENSHKSLVKRSIASLNKTSRSIRAWADCTGERDHLIFYDGSSTNDPVLAKYCGGDWLPRVVSRGQEMLVAFHSSPFSAPLQSGIPNRGFELNVDILYSDSDSYDFAKTGPAACEFHINASNSDEVLMSRRGRMGRILSPRHTLPPNTTCTYYFHGQPGDLVWISFTSYHLQILHHAINDNNTFGRGELPPWITRMRVWDSAGSYTTTKTTTPTTTASITHSNRGSGTTGIGAVNATGSSYYYTPQNPSYNGKNIKVNVDNVWNPVDQYIYGPTQNSIYNQDNGKTSGIGGGGGGSGVAGNTAPTNMHELGQPPKFDKFGKLNNGLSNVKDTFHFIANTKPQQENVVFQVPGRDYTTSSSSQDARQKSPKHSNSRRLMLEIYDNETPKLCDHGSFTNPRGRPCSPLESYVSAGKDMKIEFHTYTGTALYPASFVLNYEFVDTVLGGDTWVGRRAEEPVPPLCSRVFRNRRGEFQSPRNVFLHGRGGAKNITCLYRFEAAVGERVHLTLHNMSFGEASTCMTESDPHTGRAKCIQTENDPNARIGELKLFDVPYKDVKIPIGCFCDNTSSLYNTALVFTSNSRTMELMFTVTKLNITEDFADVYFHASYEYIRVNECRKKMRLKGSGGENDISYPLSTQDTTCEGIPWFIEAQEVDRSLFVLTWGSYLSADPTPEDAAKCTTKNRLIVYSGRPLKVMRIICPASSASRATALHIYSEDWRSSQPLMHPSKPVNMVLEPIFKEHGSMAISWLEIQRTRASLIQQLDLQTNFSLNDTLSEFGLIPSGEDCEHKCPELDACISSSLWCNGQSNCPSGHDESEEQCGTARRLLFIPGGIFAALGCIAAVLSACLIFCMFGLMRKRRKSCSSKPHSMNGTLTKDYKKEPLFLDPPS